MQVLLIDNYDSFTYNLFQCFGEFGVDILVVRNDQITINAIRRMNPSRIVISPGPKTPKEAGISKEVVRSFGEEVPILGVCLGHQCIGEVFGGRVVRAKSVMHGKTSLIYHDGDEIYKGIVNPFIAARYHSLVVEEVPDCLVITATTADGVIMGLRHRRFFIEGIQFHPESFLTPIGKDIIRNFIDGR